MFDIEGETPRIGFLKTGLDDEDMPRLDRLALVIFERT